MRGLTMSMMFFLGAGVSFGQQIERHQLEAPKVELGAQEVRLPMTFQGGRPIVEARVNGKGPYRFYFDTGASGPVMSDKLAEKLELEVIGEVGIKSGGDAADKKPIAAKLVRINQLDLASAKLSSVIIAAMDRARLGDQDAPVGVLSPAMFSGYLVTLDYPKKEVRIRSGELATPDNKTVFAYQEGRPIPSVMATIGDQKVEAHLDSGSGAGLSLPTKVAEKLTLDGKPVDTGKKARSVSGDFPVFRGQLKGKLSFGQFSVDNPTIDFSDVVQRGNLGARILDRFALTLDVKNRRFQMVEEKPAARTEHAAALRKIVDECNRQAIDAFKKGDMMAVARGYDDDATIYFPRGQKVHGRKDIDKYWMGIKGAKDWKLEVLEVGGTLDAIYEVGKSTLTTEADGKKSTYVCDYVVIWKPQKDGSYRAHTDIFN